MATNKSDWSSTDPDIFWGEIAPCDHLVQVYEHDEEVLLSLEKFIMSGLNSEESVVIIATAEHLEILNKKLKNTYDLEKYKNSGQWIPLNAHEVLAKFMKVGWPDERLFNSAISEVIKKARGDSQRKIRAFGEMVAILWAQGYNGATVQLEHLWNKFCSSEKFCLFCAYPKSGFTQDIERSIDHICSLHTKIISQGGIKGNELRYKASS